MPDGTVTPVAPDLHDRLRSIVGDDRVLVGDDDRRAASRDHAWLSPVLRARLDQLPVADLVVVPGSRGELAAVLGECHRARVPLTVRGRGTGNYGQAIPLAGGVVIDTGRLDAVLAVEDGAIVAEAGASFLRLEAEAQRSGQELAVFPSTTNSTLGGFLCGGAGGIGSIEHGLLWDGPVLGVEVLPYVDEPVARWVDGPSALGHVHTYGTTGVVSAARVGLAPRREWVAVWASFATVAAAGAAGHELMATEPCPRLIAVDDPATWSLFPHDDAFREGRVSLRALVPAGQVDEAAGFVARHGGTVDATRSGATAQLVGLSYNHVTLRAQRTRPSICHVQVGGDVLLERTAEVCAALPGGRLHLDAYAAAGRRGWGGLLLSDFVDEATLRAGMTRLEEMGVRVIDPHTWELPATDELIAVAAVFDPDGLLNPGKLG